MPYPALTCWGAAAAASPGSALRAWMRCHIRSCRQVGWVTLRNSQFSACRRQTQSQTQSQT